MQPTFALLSAALAYTVGIVLAAPIPQLAGEGAACNSILSSTDNGVGYGVKNAEDNTAKTISGLHARQLAGEGAACNSVLSQTDNGVGYGIENAEDNTAKTISGGAPKTPAMRRQLDKIANGEQAVSNALGTGATTSPVTQAADDLDGETTSGAANLGADIGNTEASSLESAGSAIPKRQLDKISNGFQNVANAAKVGDLIGPATTGLDGIDGTTTSGAAQLGADVGDTEAGTLEAAGSRVP